MISRACAAALQTFGVVIGWYPSDWQVPVVKLMYLCVVGVPISQLQNVLNQPSSHSHSPFLKSPCTHSETGSLMTNEQPLIAAMRVAVEEINSHGGILNRRLKLYLETVSLTQKLRLWLRRN